GWQDMEAGLPLREDAIFRIYSMTKPIATTALMILYEEGRLALNDPVAKYIPGFKNLKVWSGAPGSNAMSLEPLQRDATCLDLALHTAGLGYGLFTNSPVEDFYRASGMFEPNKMVYTVPLAEAIRRILELPLANQPGQRWRYSVSIDVIGHLVEIISGCPFDVFLNERIFEPLGMVDTAFYVPPEKLSRLTTMYTLTSGGTIASLDRPADSPFTDPRAMPSGGGGLVSTTNDYLRFLQMMLNGGALDGARILGPRTVAKMARNHLQPALLPMLMSEGPWWGMGFGPGFGVVLDAGQANVPCSNGTFSWGGAASTNMFIDPCEQIVAVLMTQVLNNTTPFQDYFNQIVYSAVVE
ncbi:MAG: class A beta-lactamase-related serine hydrolase, partial [Chloroflexi bacterium]